ncbi:LysM peptidoglycan-binding domain-containing protein [Aneurinibacillus aneurinilyticus]|uniref:LysM peptidoglycan-binding domain-containing protein n=1 Tax=Aneurinibacillus aneurinilyticus TaxID=1391 RepID=UPI0023F64288|nr:LysM domain-containing protein [Aneurinibacillus aneurinilyticus]MCI1696142.1 LysM peptidoglycan-binding domain-containing protein [Aneurinibacillus aneurinilyticus]
MKKELFAIPMNRSEHSGIVREIKKGDSMSSIAATFKIPLKDLLTANPHIKDYNKLSAGQDVYLPQ